jgi:hypothetical protein
MFPADVILIRAIELPSIRLVAPLIQELTFGLLLEPVQANSIVPPTVLIALVY